jgi:hypothetical protein
MYWIRNDYLDGQGNLQYWIDGINGTMINNRKAKLRINGAPKNVAIEGWVFDSRTKAPPGGFFIVIDGGASYPVDFRYDRPDVARYFSLGEEHYGHFPVGWRTEFNTESLGKGCHSISMRLVRGGSEILEIPSEYEVCF